MSKETRQQDAAIRRINIIGAVAFAIVGLMALYGSFIEKAWWHLLTLAFAAVMTFAHLAAAFGDDETEEEKPEQHEEQ